MLHLSLRNMCCCRPYVRNWEPLLCRSSTFWPCGLKSVQRIKGKNTSWPVGWENAKVRLNLIWYLQHTAFGSSGWRHWAARSAIGLPEVNQVKVPTPNCSCVGSLQGLPLCEGPLLTNQQRSVTRKSIFNTTYIRVRCPKGYPNLKSNPLC